MRTLIDFFCHIRSGVAFQTHIGVKRLKIISLICERDKCIISGMWFYEIEWGSDP
ncbi:hypothetical protein [Octadecabacter arcticus]|uniref:hypothetical protein n=1 Tax=Octadecabacter arcticus TaxID=53946 RepID=UPI00018097BC|nr:hypothetical protein [Octadecabacter arcticus]